MAHRQFALQVLPQYPARQAVRLPRYNYAGPGAYFVTICTHERRLLLGDVLHDQMTLNPTGEIVESCWKDIPLYFPNTELPVCVVMPNHLHGIVVLSGPVGTRHGVSAARAHTESFGKPVTGSLPTIIRSFKAAATKRVNANNRSAQSPLWQKGYYEHVIRSQSELRQIGEYILGNPSKWSLDRENPTVVRKPKPLPFEY